LIQQVNSDLQQRAEANARQNQGVNSIRLPNQSLIRAFQLSKPWLPSWRSSATTRLFFFAGWLLVSRYPTYRLKWQLISSLELSDDIRGERLRFVEAMQRATTVNVQLHVDEFKQQLAKEVTLMLQEVGRKLLGDVVGTGNASRQAPSTQIPMALPQPVMLPNQYLHVPGMAVSLQHHPSNGSYAGPPLPAPRPSHRKI